MAIFWMCRQQYMILNFLGSVFSFITLIAADFFFGQKLLTSEPAGGYFLKIFLELIYKKLKFQISVCFYFLNKHAFQVYVHEYYVIDMILHITCFGD